MNHLVTPQIISRLDAIFDRRARLARDITSPSTTPMVKVALMAEYLELGLIDEALRAEHDF